MILAAAFYLAMALPPRTAAQWHRPLTIEQCRHVERAAYGAWCQRIKIWKGHRL